MAEIESGMLVCPKTLEQCCTHQSVPFSGLLKTLNSLILDSVDVLIRKDETS